MTPTGAVGVVDNTTRIARVSIVSVVRRIGKTTSALRPPSSLSAATPLLRIIRNGKELLSDGKANEVIRNESFFVVPKGEKEC
jgi:hypothetical protein